MKVIISEIKFKLEPHISDHWSSIKCFSDVFFSGKDLIGVQNLLKKHQALQAEITGHEPRIKAVTQKGEAMVEEGIDLNPKIPLLSSVR